MAKKPRIARTDADFHAQANAFDAAITPRIGPLAIPPLVIDAFGAKLLVWNAKYPAVEPAQTAARMAVKEKDEARDELEPEMRALYDFFDSWHLTTDADRIAFGIPIPDTTPTPAGAVVTHKLACVVAAETMRHTIHFFLAGANKGSALPEGKGADIHVAYTLAGVAAPTDFAAYKYVANDSASPYVLEFTDPALGGMTAHYVLIWVGTNGAKGPRSEPFSKTIPQV